MVTTCGLVWFYSSGQTQTILPQLMFWSTMCRLKAPSYMTRQIKPDHKIWSTLVGYDSPIWASQQSCCFPQNPRKIRLSYYTFWSLYTDAEPVCRNCGAQIFNLCNAVEQFQQVEISQVSKLKNIHTLLRESVKFWLLSQERCCLGFTNSKN